MNNETNICLGCGIHVFPGNGHFCKHDGDQEFLKPIRERYGRLENAQIAIKGAIASKLEDMRLLYPQLPHDFVEALTFHIYKELSDEKIAWALLEIARRKETKELLEFPVFKG